MKQNKPEENRNLSVSWQPLDLFIAVSWNSEVCFFFWITEVSGPFLYLVFLCS